MQGLLQQPAEMQGAPQGAPQEMPPEGMPPETMPPEAMDEGMDEGADESHPAFQAAVQLINDTLYKEGAADNIHNVLAKGEMSADKLADIAYEMTAIADERTEGQVPDELLVLLASTSLQEVADIAIASGAQLQPADLAQAMETMILRYVGEMGHDTRALQEAMDSVPKETFNEMEV